jgi:hypothetical protein
MKRRLFWVLLVFTLVLTVSASAATLPFIRDDFAKASAQATKRRLPIFVECWAPW